VDATHDPQATPSGTGPFRHVLVPVDFTEKNRGALDVARQWAQEHQAHVTLLHVIETIDYVADEEIDRFYEMLKKRARMQLEPLCAPFEQANLKVEGKIVLGKRARGIVTFAVQHNVDLVVMSSHKVNLSEAPRGWGTLSHQVSILCPCAVLLVK
jgi:universal stress protein A